MPAVEFASTTRAVIPALLRIPAHGQFARIEVKLSEPLSTKYREVVVASNGERLWTLEFPASILPATKKSTIVLPTSILKPGSYHLLLEKANAEGGFEGSKDWVFHVESQ